MALNKLTKSIMHLNPQTGHIVAPNDIPCIGGYLRIDGRPINMERLVGLLVEDNKLVAVISSNTCGVTKEGKFCMDTYDHNKLCLIAENSRSGWVHLHRLLRLHFTPFNFS